MYAHQVIENFKVLHSHKDFQKPSHKTYKDAIAYCTHGIGEFAAQFHLGDLSPEKTQNGGLFSIKEGNPLFAQCNDLYNLPYSACYFDWYRGEGNIRKQAALVVDRRSKDNGHLEIHAMQFFQNINTWALSRYLYKACPGTGKCEIIDLINDGLSDHEYDDGILTKIEKIILLLNCKNIQIEKISPPDKLNKKRASSGKQKLFSYHVLNISIPSQRRSCLEKSEPLSHNRVHLCRGHFKEYTQEHPLFGKYTGLYWWQPHVRGQNKDGIVMKDYNVEVK